MYRHALNGRDCVQGAGCQRLRACVEVHSPHLHLLVPPPLGWCGSVSPTHTTRHSHWAVLWGARPMWQVAHPMLHGARPMLRSAYHMLRSASRVLHSAYPVLHSAYPVLCGAHPMLHGAHNVFH